MGSGLQGTAGGPAADPGDRYGVREEEAMATVTSNAALAMGLEQECGRIVPGGQADLTLLDGSPLRLATAVRYTLSGGRVIYRQEK